MNFDDVIGFGEEAQIITPQLHTSYRLSAEAFYKLTIMTLERNLCLPSQSHESLNPPRIY